MVNLHCGAESRTPGKNRDIWMITMNQNKADDLQDMIIHIHVSASATIDRRCDQFNVSAHATSMPVRVA